MHHFYRKLRTGILGSENGKNLFKRPEQEVEKFNECCDGTGGCAKMHWYSIEDSDDNTDKDNEELQLPKQRKRRKEKLKPFILAVCTPLMARIHRNVVQSSQMVFCDALLHWTGSILLYLFSQPVTLREVCHWVWY